LTYIVQDFTGFPADIPENHIIMFDENNAALPWPPRIEALGADRKFAPFVLDLSDLLPVWATNDFRSFFLGTTASPNRYGALYFKNLPPISDTPSENTLTSYLTRFSTPIFGTAVTRIEGGGDYKINR